MNTESVLFALLRIAVCGEQPTEEVKNACTPEMLDAVCALADHHDLTHLVGQAASRLDLPESDALAKCKKRAMQAFLRYTQQNYDYEQVCKTLEGGKIPFIPLKGSVLRKYYPEPWLRTSCDMDILVRPEDLDRASALLQEKLNYRYQGRTSHDLCLYSPGGVNLELHYCVIEDFVSQSAERILSGIWEDAKPVPNSAYHMEISDALFYYYHMAHMAKHFVNGGCGIRAFLDVWILNDRMHYDKSARQALLERGQLLTFGKAAEKLSRIWFSGEAPDQLTEHMQRYIFEGGTYGSLQNRVSINQSKQGGRLKYALSKIFLPYDILKHTYPVLQKHRILTPVYQVVRWCRLLFCGGVKRSVRELRVNAAVSHEEEMTAEKLLKYLEL